MVATCVFCPRSKGDASSKFSFNPSAKAVGRVRGVNGKGRAFDADKVKRWQHWTLGCMSANGVVF